MQGAAVFVGRFEGDLELARVERSGSEVLGLRVGDSTKLEMREGGPRYKR